MSSTSSEAALAPQRVAVFLDHQNVIQVGHRLYARGRDVRACIPEPTLVADKIAQRRNVPSQVTTIRAYGGRPSSTHEPELAGVNDRQAAQWQRRDQRVRMIRRPLSYRGWPDDPPIEKGIDVSLAIDLVEYKLLHKGEHDVLVVFSSDTDLMPAIDLCFNRWPEPPIIEVACWEGATPLQRRVQTDPDKWLPYCHFFTAADWRQVTRDWTGR